MEINNNYGDISNLFIRLIGYLNLILKFKSYQEDYDNYKEILDFINNWAVLYEKNRTLNFINNNDLINIYEKADDLQTKYICNNKMGSESEFSDYVVNLIWKLRIHYKKCIEGDRKEVVVNIEDIIYLFRKIITSLSCIEKVAINNELKVEATQYILDLINQYQKIIESNEIKDINFKYTEEDLIDFSYRCIENKENDLVRLGEDVQFGIIELTKLLNKI